MTWKTVLSTSCCLTSPGSNGSQYKVKFSEFKVVETDDGFRIEIKGDKEAIRRMLEGFGPKSFFRAGMPFGRGLNFGFGPGFWAGFGCGPWWDTEEGKAKKA